MPLLNKNGEVMIQKTFWISETLDKLVKADHLNLSAFVREQLEEMFSDGATVETLNQRFRLLESAKAHHSRQKSLNDEEAEIKQRLKDRIRKERSDRQVVEDQDAEHQQNLENAWNSLEEQGLISLARIQRALPENDTYGERWDYLESLTQNLSRVNGDSFTEAEVVAYVKQLT